MLHLFTPCSWLREVFSKGFIRSQSSANCWTTFWPPPGPPPSSALLSKRICTWCSFHQLMTSEVPSSMPLQPCWRCCFGQRRVPASSSVAAQCNSPCSGLYTFKGSNFRGNSQRQACSKWGLPMDSWLPNSTCLHLDFYLLSWWWQPLWSGGLLYRWLLPHQKAYWIRFFSL